ncbi:GL15832 [Drosophila persimilis]|uniref:GL15832 n=1 Tax=Drosophila persimilis TaxID=7234 RepID=B4H104_DROPE|nr:GL15832 [Drosophila persimilis]
MSIKIYLPIDYFTLKKPTNLYGQVQINEDVVYYVVDAVDFDFNTASMEHGTISNLRFLGSILCSDTCAEKPNIYHQLDMRICFTYDKKEPNISLGYIGITPEHLKQIKIILYHKKKVQDLFVNDESTLDQPSGSGGSDCDFLELFRLAQSEVAIHKPKNRALKSGLHLLLLVADAPIQLFKYTAENVFINNIMGHTTGIINQLYSLLNVLEGSPIGLKLNIHLNNFFLDCFKYHIQLWSMFLDLIEPIVRQVFLAIGVFGCLGFTFQIALLADLISIVSLHSHCFHIYTKVLYKVEKKGLSVLWQVVRGNRYNILKGRIEAHNYMDRQLYLATIFFSAILFLFPTTLVYYVVFAFLKSLTHATLAIFEFFRRKLLFFPLEVCLKWLRKELHEIDCLKIEDVALPAKTFLLHKHYKINVAVYKIRV